MNYLPFCSFLCSAVCLLQLISGPSVLNKYVGQSEENVRNLFTAAEEDAKAIKAAEEAGEEPPRFVSSFFSSFSFFFSLFFSIFLSVFIFYYGNLYHE